MITHAGGVGNLPRRRCVRTIIRGRTKQIKSFIVPERPEEKINAGARTWKEGKWGRSFDSRDDDGFRGGRKGLQFL